MSDDWQPGDLAMIVRQGVIDCPHRAATTHTGEKCPRRGAVRTVTAVQASVLPSGTKCGCTELWFSDREGAVAQRCKKIRPHTPDAEDAETIALLKGGRVPA